jgi:hypothetical protein
MQREGLHNLSRFVGNKAFGFGSQCLAAGEAGILPGLAINLVPFFSFPLQIVAFRKFI